MGLGSKRTLTKTRNKTRDIDQIKLDLQSPRHLELHKEIVARAPEDLPGLGRHYCIECAKWYESELNFVAHRRGKPHKRRVKALKEKPYTQEESEAAAGIGAASRKYIQPGNTGETTMDTSN